MMLRRPVSFLLSLSVLPLALAFVGCTSLQSISILPGSVQLTSAGQTVQFTAIGTGQMGSAPTTTSNITTQVTWSVTNPNVATINQGGLATAVGNGTTEVMAESGGITATSDITVSITAGSGSGSGTPYINITPGTGSETFIGETTQFVATGSLSGGASQNLTSQVTWISSNAQVATINSSGLATAVGSGATTIIAQSGGATATAALNVTIGSNSSDATIAIVPTSATASFAGETTQFIALGTLTSGTPTQNITGSVAWTSSDISVATVDQNGLATAVGSNTVAETTTITAIGTLTGGGVISTSATLTVPAQGTGVTLPTLAVYLTGTGTGTVTSSPGSLDCGAANGTCTNNYSKSSTVTLTAAAAAGSVFGGWSSNCTPVSSSPTDPTTGAHLQCSVSMTNNETVGAIFNP